MKTNINKKRKIKNKSKLKVALVHDYLREYGGAERVVEALHEIFPDAPLYVSFVDSSVTGIHWHKFEDWTIYQSWLTKIPFYKKLFSPLRVFAPQYFSAMDLSDYDVVISSTNAYFSKAVSHGEALHISYCHTPARSLYGYTTMTNWKSKPVIRFFGTLINHYLRIIDVKIAEENVDFFIANSQETKRRIKKFYRLDSTVIYPPIEIKKGRNFSKIAKLPDKNGYFLVVGRLAVSKHVDLAIKAASKLGFNLKVVGTGKGLSFLQEMAGDSLNKNIEFLGAVSDDDLFDLYENSVALLYPAEDEDFGMVPIEAMGHGIPVVAHRSGGPLETVKEGKNGFFFDEFTIESFGDAVAKIKKTKWSKQDIYTYALKFGKDRFKEEVLSFVKRVLH
jgi:glycosyltransferase involved in cell wall biosynthesis